MKIEQDAIVVFIGAMGTGKSTFGKTHFLPHDIVSSDFIREQLTGNFEDQECSATAIRILFSTVEHRAKAGMLTVVDTTGNNSVLQNVEQIAKKYKRPLIAIKFPELPPEEITEERFKHRWKYKEVYDRQVERINNQSIPSTYTLYNLNENDAFSIEFESYSEMHTLAPQYSYVVIPDLHGEYRILEHYIEKYKDDDNIKFISLGDIVDRGESSYKTFTLVFDLIAEGKMFVVQSNHDNKLYRYFKKWHVAGCEDESFTTLGMTINHGLRGTLEEFYSLSWGNKHRYSVDFIKYYENAHPYLTFDKKDTTHYFVHAGISAGIARGQYISKRDISAVLYETLLEPDVLTDLFKSHETDVHVHTGHLYDSDTITFLPDKNGTRWIVRHDIGIGKRVIDEIPEFMVIP